MQKSIIRLIDLGTGTMTRIVQQCQSERSLESRVHTYSYQNVRGTLTLPSDVHPCPCSEPPHHRRIRTPWGQTYVHGMFCSTVDLRVLHSSWSPGTSGTSLIKENNRLNQQSTCVSISDDTLMISLTDFNKRYLKLAHKYTFSHYLNKLSQEVEAGQVPNQYGSKHLIIINIIFSNVVKRQNLNQFPYFFCQNVHGDVIVFSLNPQGSRFPQDLSLVLLEINI